LDDDLKIAYKQAYQKKQYQTEKKLKKLTTKTTKKKRKATSDNRNFSNIKKYP
jgi:hypothetical protein